MVRVVASFDNGHHVKNRSWRNRSRRQERLWQEGSEARKGWRGETNKVEAERNTIKSPPRKDHTLFIVVQ